MKAAVASGLVLALVAATWFGARVYQSQQFPPLEGNDQLIRALLTLDDVPPIFVIDSQSVWRNTHRRCRGERYERAFNNILSKTPSTGPALVHTTEFCENVDQAKEIMRDRATSFAWNSSTISLTYVATGQKPANSDQFFAVCYVFNDIRSCEANARYGRVILTLTINLTWGTPWVTQARWLDWVFHRNDEIISSR